MRGCSTRFVDMRAASQQAACHQRPNTHLDARSPLYVENAHYQDTKNTKKRKLGVLTWCSWCLGGESVYGRPSRMRAEKSAAPSAALARSVMSLRALSSSKGRRVSSTPRSYQSSGRYPLARLRHLQGFTGPTRRAWSRIVVVQLCVGAVYQRGCSARRLSSSAESISRARERSGDVCTR